MPTVKGPPRDLATARPGCILNKTGADRLTCNGDGDANDR